MCIAHFNPQNQVYIIKALYLLNGLHQCWTLTICKKRNLRGWYFNEACYSCLLKSLSFHNINCEWANTVTTLNKMLNILLLLLPPLLYHTGNTTKLQMICNNYSLFFLLFPVVSASDERKKFSWKRPLKITQQKG